MPFLCLRLYQHPRTAAVVAMLLLSITASTNLPRSVNGATGSNSQGQALTANDVAVVVNSNDPLSEQIGAFYAQTRGIPARQLIRIRFPPGQPSLSAQTFRPLRNEILRRTPTHVQAYAIAWREPWRVDCQSITSALSLGVDAAWCARGCHRTRRSPYYGETGVQRPWQQLGIRPSMVLAGTDLQQVRRLILRGKAADGTAPPGTVYLLSTSDRLRNVRAAVFGDIEQLMTPWLAVKVLQTDRLVGANDVIGLFTGLARVEGLETLRFRPGAVADHLTSYGGELTPEPTPSGQMSALRWLEAGATGSYGTVVEPCNIPDKFPNPAVLLSHYRRGDTLIEAYWRSVAMPGQGVFIGEPLARPWTRRSVRG